MSNTGRVGRVVPKATGSAVRYAFLLVLVSEGWVIEQDKGAGSREAGHARAGLAEVSLVASIRFVVCTILVIYKFVVRVLRTIMLSLSSLSLFCRCS